MKKCKEAKKAKRVAQSKKGNHINIGPSKERRESSTPTPWRCISQMVTFEQNLGGTDVTLQAQAHRGHKHGKA